MPTWVEIDMDAKDGLYLTLIMAARGFTFDTALLPAKLKQVHTALLIYAED